MKYFTEIKDELKNTGCDFSENAELKGLTTFKIGGCTPLLVKPCNTTQLACALGILKKYQTKFFLLGNGSNLLIADEGVDYPVILLSQGEFTAIEASGTTVIAGAGALLVSVCRKAQECALSGLEFAYGIPGSVGGGVYMNAGAYGGELADVLESVEYLDADGHLHHAAVEDLALSYRHSCFMQQQAVIVRVAFRLTAGDADAIRAAMDDVMRRRREKQPLEFPSAGSTFKRPEGYFAGKLIEDAGLKGFQIGGARVSEKHAGFIINADHATQHDVSALIAHIQKIVKEKFGVEMTPEIRFVQ